MKERELTKGFELQELDESYFLIYTVDEETSCRVVEIPEITAYLWQRIMDSSTQKFTEETLARLITEEYEVEYEIALEDSALILEEWITSGIAQ